MVVGENIVKEFKEHVRISHDSEDDSLKRKLVASYADIQEKCGSFDIDKHSRGKELVFERTRYVINDALEYFDKNFISQINSLSFELYEPSEEGAPDETL